MSKNPSIVLTILGKDRPGLVRKVSKIIADNNGNWLDSRLAELAGYFGGLLHISIPEDRTESLYEALKDLKSEGIDIILGPTGYKEKPDDSLEVDLDLVGNDRPGIVNSVTEAIASRGANLLELSTEYSSAPMSGQEIFKATAKIQFPSKASLNALRSDLEKIASDLMVDIEVK